MLKTIVRTTATAVLPGFINDAVNYGVTTVKNMFNSISEDSALKPKKTHIPTLRKPSDNTKFTKRMNDIIIGTHAYWALNKGVLSNGVYCKNTQELAKYLNHKLKLNKSVSSYSRVWNGHVDRNSLK